MNRQTEQTPDLIDLGVASDVTQGMDGTEIEGVQLQPMAGISDD